MTTFMPDGSFRHSFAVPPPSRREAFRIRFVQEPMLMICKSSLENVAPSGRELDAEGRLREPAGTK